MKKRISVSPLDVCSIAIALAAALALPVRVAAQDQHSAHHPHYRSIDLGTFGGHHSEVDGGSVVINSRGTVVGGADTADPCPYFPDAPISPAFKWENGVMTELPRLPGGCSGFPIAINDHGLIVGVADNGVLDPFTEAPEIHAVVWQDGRILDLGTFGGPNSLAGAVNERGQITGVAQNAVSDPFNFGNIISLPNSTEWRGFLWQDGVMHDLGTLGGPDAAVSGFLALNERGQVLGISFTNDIANPVTGVPTLDSRRKAGSRNLGGYFYERIDDQQRRSNRRFFELARRHDHSSVCLGSGRIDRFGHAWRRQWQCALEQRCRRCDRNCGCNRT